ncbi:DNA topoisomerase I [Halobacteriales archaeon SW_5_70_135]|nr:MAG: DNA topoisomerase I [Halobacteriales archaeon SW_5_70_135]
MDEDRVELIVTEKDNAARRIADILSDGAATVGGEEVNVYRWTDSRDVSRVCVGLSGHVVGVDFPPEYEDWRAVEPAELIDADLRKTPTRADIVRELRSLARAADRVTIATDYDREGELIGKEAYEIVREETDAPVDRVRFSSITDREVRRAFDEPDEVDFDLAAAGEARQVVDLMWGAALTRFLSLSAGRLGDEFVSVGRVQSPTLRLIVERERAIQRFDPEDYWELYADLSAADEAFEAQYFYEDDGEQERIWEEKAAERARGTVAGADAARVTEVRRRTRTDRPPAPFDTTAFISAAGSLGYGAERAMSAAEDLYTAGYVTYPRTDNTVYPDDLDPDELLGALAELPEIGVDAASLRASERDGDGEIEPTRGDTESTDHPPIHPTDELPDLDDLSEAEAEVYELVVRRFLATVAEPAEWADLRVVADADGARLKANGRRLLSPGYHAVYPYVSSSEAHLPDVTEGDALGTADVRLAAKQTQPPQRYSQSRLVELMKERGIGTKSTRHHVIDKLYDRGYVDGDPPRPTRLATAVVDAAEEYAEQIVSEEMTRRLERDMTAIAEGEATLEAVTEESREMLRTVFDDLSENHEAVGDLLRESLKEDASLGPCPDCGERLLVRRSRSGSAFVGCDGYPDCEFTLPLPDRGEPEITDDVCEEHALHEVRMLDGRNTYTHGCPVCQAEAAGDGPLVGSCPDCGRDHGGDLQVKQLQNGSRLVGCDRYPDCEYSLPLPRRGDLAVTDDRCAEHGLREVVVDADSDDPWELGCPVCNFREYRARQAEQGGDLDLAAVEGVDDETRETLAAADVTSVADLVGADPADLADRTGMEEHRARGLRRAAIAAVEGLDEDGDDDEDGDESGRVDPDAESSEDGTGAEA